MTGQFDLAGEHVALVRDILRTHLPPGVAVSVFGSRAQGGARRYSDLDLALQSDHPLGLGLLGELAEAFLDSDLPFKVDLVDLAAVDSAFRARVAAHAVPLPL